jgi:hypothetical protein
VGVDTREGRGCYAAGVAAPGLSGAICAQVIRCQRRPGVSDDVDHRRRNWKAKHGRPPGRRMLCGWRCGSRLTASQMRAHFTICAKRPAGLDHVADAEGNSQAMRGGPRGPRMKCGWIAAPSSLGAAICAHTSPYARSGRQPLTTTAKVGTRSHAGAPPGRECCAAGSVRLRRPATPKRQSFRQSGTRLAKTCVDKMTEY